LLGCNSSEEVVLHLLNKSRKVLQYTVYLINAMASEVVGRNYLIQDNKILETLFSVLLNEKGETIIR